MQENTKCCSLRKKTIPVWACKWDFFQFSLKWLFFVFFVLLVVFFFLFEFCSFLCTVKKQLGVWACSFLLFLLFSSQSCSWHLQSVPGTVSIPVSGRLSSGLQEYVQLPVQPWTWTSSRGSAGETTSISFFFMYNTTSRTSSRGSSLSFYFEVELLHLCLFWETDQKAN